MAKCFDGLGRKPLFERIAGAITINISNMSVLPRKLYYMSTLTIFSDSLKLALSYK